MIKLKNKECASRKKNNFKQLCSSGNIFKRIKNKLYKFCKMVLSSKGRELIKWRIDNGDNTLRINYNLNRNSIVFDVGGYKGDWSKKIFQKHECNLYVFEPVDIFYTGIKNRFKKNKKIKVYNFGLFSKNLTTRISFDNDSSSVYKENKSSKDIKLVKASEFLSSMNFKQIDLIKINIEGSEYELMNNLIDSGWIEKTKNIQIQFHDFISDSKKKREAIHKKLLKTHVLTYNYDFVWENWRKNV